MLILHLNLVRYLLWVCGLRSRQLSCILGHPRSLFSSFCFFQNKVQKRSHSPHGALFLKYSHNKGRSTKSERLPEIILLLLPKCEVSPLYKNLNKKGLYYISNVYFNSPSVYCVCLKVSWLWIMLFGFLFEMCIFANFFFLFHDCTFFQEGMYI